MYDLDEERVKLLVSTNLKDLMLKEGVSEVLLSEKTEISQSAINRIKNGSVCPSLAQITKLADFFSIGIDNLLVEKSNKNSFPEKKTFIPIIDSINFIKEGSKDIQGFIGSNESFNNTIGFKYDSSFSCSILKKDTVIVTKKIEKNEKIMDGNTVLFIDKDSYKIGTFIKGSIKTIDNLFESYQLKDVKLIGVVLKIETNYIKNKDIISQIIQKMGAENLTSILNNTLEPSI
jgi:transcriptional regulator with XRE-family HTH domain